MKIFTNEYLNNLSNLALESPRKRKHSNIHTSYQEKCQRFFNAIEPDSYIRPHRHASDPRDELLIAIRGLMVLVTFNENGDLNNFLYFGSQNHTGAMSCGVEVPADVWHTVIALETGCILLEVKEGPFDPDRPKDLAPWAPEEKSIESFSYLKKIIEKISK